MMLLNAPLVSSVLKMVGRNVLIALLLEDVSLLLDERNYSETINVFFYYIF